MDTSSVSRRSGWVSLCVTAAARSVLVALASLALWAVAPAALGLHPTVVMTGSMLPRLVPGDIVLSRPVPVSQLQLGQTLLFPDPDRPGHLRLHRWVNVDPDGRLVTKGDANASNDSTTIARTDVTGVASLRVPWIGRPVVWVNEGRTGSLLVSALGLIVVVGAAFWYRREDDEAPSADDDVDREPADERVDQPAGAHRARRLAHAGAALLVIVGLGSTYATSADAATAKFARQTTTPVNSWRASPYFSCAGATRGDGATLTYPLDEATGTVANDIGPYSLDGTYSNVTTRSATGGPCGGRSVTLNGTSGQVTTPTAAKVQAPNTFTWEIWFKTAANSSRGGKIIGFDTSQTGTAAQYDRHVYMTNTGQLVFGVYTGTASTVDSGAARYNDNKWHLVDAALSPAGMRLYVDGALVDSDTSVTSGEDYQGWLRIGYGSLGGSWPSLPTSNWFGGSVAYASAYLVALTPSQVAGHYAVGKP